MKLFVTGGAGFIGSNFTRMALTGRLPGLEDAEITVFDALTYSGTLTNLEEVADNPRYSFVKGDIRDADAVRDAMAGHDAIVHFAAESHVDRSVTDAGIFVETNVLGTQRLLDAAMALGIHRFVHVSTDEVYGSIDDGEWTEDEPLLPNSPYS
ncbi:MAG: GDP-mannose 4,6-dehydratase, partial [Aquiluna sp.]